MSFPVTAGFFQPLSIACRNRGVPAYMSTKLPLAGQPNQWPSQTNRLRSLSLDSLRSVSSSCAACANEPPPWVLDASHPPLTHCTPRTTLPLYLKNVGTKNIGRKQPLPRTLDGHVILFLLSAAASTRAELSVRLSQGAPKVVNGVVVPRPSHKEVASKKTTEG